MIKSIIFVAESRLWCYDVPQGFSGEVPAEIIKLPIAKNVVTVSGNNDLIRTDCGKEEMNEKYLENNACSHSRRIDAHDNARIVDICCRPHQ